ncbi:MAG: alpha-amylase family glycosyl hydrolase [Candidatus Limnocylindria bacterium]
MTSHRWPAAVVAASLLAAACGGPTVSPAPGAATTPPPTPSPTAAGAPACRARPTAAPATAAWWHDRVFYEVFVRSFADSDGDGIGDLRGLTERLDHLNDGDPTTSDDLGVTALWLMPVAESPSYHGYDVTDYRRIEPDYGTQEDFIALVAAARERGIEIVVDLVVNHSSREHPWFEASAAGDPAYADWYVWADERPPVSGPAGRPVWHQLGGRWYYGYFWEGMPDLDVSNDAVTAELDDIARFWVDEMGVAGFRLDAARHLIEDGAELENTPETFDWLRGFRERLQAVEPGALVLGEVWDATSVASRYVREGALDLAFEFGLASQILSAVRFGDPGSLAIVQAEVSAAYPVDGYAVFLTNHDQDRAFDVLGRDPAAARQAATLLLTDPGIPFLYYGEEVGLRGRKPDERIRTPMPWTGEAPGYGFTSGTPWQAMADGVEASNVAAQARSADSLLSWYRQLIAARTAHPALSGGRSIPLESAVAGVYATLRVDDADDEAVVVVSNLTDEPVGDVRLSLLSGPLCGSPTAAVLLGTDTGAVVAAPVVTAEGGLDGWSIGSLAPHGDVLVALRP